MCSRVNCYFVANHFVAEFDKQSVECTYAPRRLSVFAWQEWLDVLTLYEQWINEWMNECFHNPKYSSTSPLEEQRWKHCTQWTQQCILFGNRWQDEIFCIRIFTLDVFVSLRFMSFNGLSYIFSVTLCSGEKIRHFSKHMKHSKSSNIQHMLMLWKALHVCCLLANTCGMFLQNTFLSIQ